MKLSEKQLRVAVCALHVAAVQYITDAAFVDNGTAAGGRLRDAFKGQSAEALALAEAITAEIG